MKNKNKTRIYRNRQVMYSARPKDNIRHSRRYIFRYRYPSWFLIFPVAREKKSASCCRENSADLGPLPCLLFPGRVVLQRPRGTDTLRKKILPKFIARELFIFARAVPRTRSLRLFLFCGRTSLARSSRSPTSL